MLTLDEIKELLDKPCLVCGKANRFHKVFYSPDKQYYVRQSIEKDFNGEHLVTRHWAILDNLEYLEYMEAKKRERDS